MIKSRRFIRRFIPYLLLLFCLTFLVGVVRAESDDDGPGLMEEEHGQGEGKGEDDFSDPPMEFDPASTRDMSSTPAPAEAKGLSIRLSDPVPSPLFNAPSGMEQIRILEPINPKDSSKNVPADVLGNR